MAAKSEGQAEKLLRDLGRKLDELIEKGKTTTGDIKDDLGGTTDELKKTRDKVENEILRFRENNKEAIDEIRDGFGRAGAELKKTFNTVFRSKKKKKKAGKKKGK